MGVIGYIDYIRLIVEAIHQGRIDAQTVAGMDDAQIEAYIQKLQSDTQAEIDHGREIDPG